MRRIWWIDEDRLAGSANPTESELKDLRSEGFASIVCLLDPSEQRPNYDPDAARKMGYAWICIPIPDFAPPSLGDFQEFRRFVEDAVAEGKVLVHCQGGSGRTGTIGAAYWISKGLSAREAREKVRGARPGAIEAPEQRSWLEELEVALRDRSIE